MEAEPTPSFLIWSPSQGDPRGANFRAADHPFEMYSGKPLLTLGAPRAMHERAAKKPYLELMRSLVKV